MARGAALWLCLQSLLCICSLFIVAGACPWPGWQRHGSSCYTFGHTKATQHDAQVLCRRMNAHLVEIDSADENRFLTQFSLTHIREGLELWLGVEDKHQEGQFVLSSSGQQPSYTNWAPGQPDNRNQRSGDEDCAVLLALGGQWVDIPCYRPHPFICEIGGPAPITTTTTTTTTTAPCTNVLCQIQGASWQIHVNATVPPATQSRPLVG